MHMVSIKVGTNDRRSTVLVESNKTLREILEDNEINYATAAVYLDGSTLNPGDMDKTLDDFGIGESCYLVAVIKTTNA